jgi:D-xylose transport system ATP-binding protein
LLYGEVHAAEVVALVGDNGAGKSTLIKIISGTVISDSGAYVVDGHPIRIRGPNDVTRRGIATVYQDLALCENLDVVGNLYLGRELASGELAPLDEIHMERTALDLLARLSVVARSVMANARVVLLDEPTAALGVVQTSQVLDLVKTLRSQGLGVVIISHNLADVFEVCDRIVVLRLGRRVASFEAVSLNQERVVAAITGAEFGAA